MAIRNLCMLLAAAVLLTLIASGCGNGDGGREAGRMNGGAADGEPEAVVTLYNFKVEMAEQLNALAEAYERKTGVGVEVDTCGGGCDYSAGLKTKFSSGDQPDVFFVAGHSDLNLWEEYLEDLSDQPWVDDIVDIARPAITRDGKVYGMPLAMEGWGFVYNKDLFRQAGIAGPPATLSGLREAAVKLQAAGIRPFENGYAEWWILGNHLINVAFAQQPDPVGFIEAVRSGREKLTGNVVLEQWLDLVDLTVEFGQENSLQTDYNTQVTHFANGNAAMMQQGVWTQLQIDKINPGLDIGFLPMPINDDAEAMDKLQIGVPNYWVVNRSSRVKAEAKAFLRWLAASDDGKRFIREEARFIPPFKSIPADSQVLGPLASDIMEYMESGKMLPWLWQRYPGYEANTSQMASQVQAYIGGRIGREQLLEEFQKIWDDLSAQ